MRILIFTYLLGSHFGPGKQIAVLSSELKRLGHQVVVLSQTFVPPDNQYRLELQASGAPLYSPGKWADQPWERHKLLRAGLLSPRILWQLARALAHGQPWAAAWKQARLSVYQLSLPDWTRVWAAHRLNRLNREAPFDIVHTFSGIGMIFAWARQRHVKLVYNENIVPSPQENWWDDVRRWVHHVDAIVSVCAAAEPHIRAQFSYQGPIAVIAPTLFPPVLIQSPQKQSAARQPITFGVAARLHKPKGHEYLVRAFHRLKRQYPAIAARLLVAGDGGERRHLENLVQELNLQDDITFLGVLDADQMECFWSQIDVFVLPSLWEGLPVVILEAMAHAKPVIATDVDGVAEAVQDHRTGLLTPPADVEALSVALTRLAQDTRLRLALGQAGYERFQAQFSPQVIIPQYVEVYRRVIADQKSRLHQ